MDYLSLIAQIQRVINRSDPMFVEEIPNIIKRAINRIYNQAKSIGFTSIRNDSFIPGTAIQRKPLGWKETISITLALPNQTAKLLLPRSYEFCITYAATGLTAPREGIPTFYNDIQYEYYLLSPIPDLDYGYSMFYRSLPIFNEDNPTNFLTLRYEGLLLYASLLEAIPFLKDDERIPTFQSLYDRELQMINHDKLLNTVDHTSKGDIS